MRRIVGVMCVLLLLAVAGGCSSEDPKAEARRMVTGYKKAQFHINFAQIATKDNAQIVADIQAGVKEYLYHTTYEAFVQKNLAASYVSLVKATKATINVENISVTLGNSGSSIYIAFEYDMILKVTTPDQQEGKLITKTGMMTLGQKEQRWYIIEDTGETLTKEDVAKTKVDKEKGGGAKPTPF